MNSSERLNVVKERRSKSKPNKFKNFLKNYSNYNEDDLRTFCS